MSFLYLRLAKGSDAVWMCAVMKAQCAAFANKGLTSLRNMPAISTPILIELGLMLMN